MRVSYERVCCCVHLWISLDRKPNTGPSLMDCCLINPSPIPDCCLNPSPIPEGGRRRPVPLLSIDRSDGPRCNNIPPFGGRLEGDGGINADDEVTEPLSDFSDNAMPEDIRMVEDAEDDDLNRGEETGGEDTAAVCVCVCVCVCDWVWVWACVSNDGSITSGWVAVALISSRAVLSSSPSSPSTIIELRFFLANDPDDDDADADNGCTSGC